MPREMLLESIYLVSLIGTKRAMKVQDGGPANRLSDTSLGNFRAPSLQFDATSQRTVPLSVAKIWTHFISLSAELLHPA